MFSLPAPFTCSWHITPALIDHYGHVNNVAYVKQIETVAWLHSNNLGLSIEQYKALDRGMAIRTHHLEYHHPLHLDDTVTCATWITYVTAKPLYIDVLRWLISIQVSACLAHKHNLFVLHYPPEK